MTRMRVFVESVGDEALASVLLRSLPITIEHGNSDSSALAGAESALVMRPEIPVAVLFGTREMNGAGGRE